MKTPSLVKRDPDSLVLSSPQKLDQHPAAIYLAGLSTDTGRVSMKGTLEKIAAILTQGRATVAQVNWSKVRFQHATALRTRLLEEAYKPATVNKYLSALRGVLKASWQLGQMMAEDYHKAVSVKGVKGQALPAGRELSPGELRSCSASTIISPQRQLYFPVLSRFVLGNSSRKSGFEFESN